MLNTAWGVAFEAFGVSVCVPYAFFEQEGDCPFPNTGCVYETLRQRCLDQKTTRIQC